jgi:hypothetical protein
MIFIFINLPRQMRPTPTPLSIFGRPPLVMGFPETRVPIIEADREDISSDFESRAFIYSIAMNPFNAIVMLR